MVEKMRNVTNFNFEELNKFDKIYVLVSGGIDSTYLFEIIKQECNIEKVYAVNCFNPFETNETLKEISKYERFIQIKAENELDYAKVLNDSFRNIPKALEMRAEGKYTKHVFSCCKYIKHNAFKNHSLFKESNTVVISGIKPTDGMQRRLWLISLLTGKTTTKNVVIENAPTFYYKHKTGQMYCYPFRDFKLDKSVEVMKGSEFPKEVMEELYQKYPSLNHSGCHVCPVLVVFADKILKSRKSNKNDIDRVQRSIKYYEELKKNSEVL